MSTYQEGHSSALQMLEWLATDQRLAVENLDNERPDVARVHVRNAQDVTLALASLLKQLLPIADEMAARLPARAISLQQQRVEATRLAGLLEVGADPKTIARQLRDNIHGGEHPPEAA